MTASWFTLGGGGVASVGGSAGTSNSSMARTTAVETMLIKFWPLEICASKTVCSMLLMFSEKASDVFCCSVLVM